MSIALLMVALLLGVMLLLSRASEPSMVVAANARADDAEARIGPLETQVARYRPTPKPCWSGTSYEVENC